MAQHDTMSTCLAIGIEKITAVRNMATVLPLAKDKDGIRYILETIQKELEEGVAEIDHLI